MSERGYREDADGNVVLTMSREDFDRTLRCIAVASVRGTDLRAGLALANRLNRGNPAWTAYCEDDGVDVLDRTMKEFLQKR